MNGRKPVKLGQSRAWCGLQGTANGQAARMDGHAQRQDQPDKTSQTRPARQDTQTGRRRLGVMPSVMKSDRPAGGATQAGRPEQVPERQKLGDEWVGATSDPKEQDKPARGTADGGSLRP
ncbi:hypothetical protein BO71DRAFT_393752 [Aspergillus ellipticus CBS 707.79]|uniref:Uncharacterized protein n=1 Tax=Aspergillus ellipticus CBS 707.79 TaxID=1448320 RepID=A0A319DV24_9EURO|nr:hypothetical protein BO71DRAFT_393752 [Aspergillus ellipticus CBS 707.79]